MRGHVVIAGVGQTAFGKLPGRNTTSLNIEACRNALADAGVEKDAVDALLVKPPTSSPVFMYGQTLAEAMGLQPRVGGAFDQGGAANISLISFAAMAIEHGQCDIALVTYADNPRTGSRHAYEKAWGDDAAHGWFGVPAGYAMLARRHMEEFGTTSDQLGAIAVAIRKHGAANPNAPITPQIGAISSSISSPIEPKRLLKYPGMPSVNIRPITKKTPLTSPTITTPASTISKVLNSDLIRPLKGLMSSERSRDVPTAPITTSEVAPPAATAFP